MYSTIFGIFQTFFFQSRGATIAFSTIVHLAIKKEEAWLMLRELDLIAFLFDVKVSNVKVPWIWSKPSNPKEDQQYSHNEWSSEYMEEYLRK